MLGDNPDAVPLMPLRRRERKRRLGALFPWITAGKR
jgi:hypothetical protein